jgi:hypothetical protein
MKVPEKGEKIYVPGAMYVYRGMDDFAGGIATVSNVTINTELPSDNNNRVFVSIEERSTHSYNWYFLEQDQEKLKEMYKEQIAHPDPDCRPEFNDDDEGWH